MCGFVGGIFRGAVEPRDVAALRTAVRTLTHRGPDAEGVEVVAAAGAVLGFRRLAIIDLATGDQPMSVDGTHHLVFNGEIYNYRDVRRALESEGVRFSTASDTEVLLRSLMRSGGDGLAALRGMFAFGFLDVPGRRLLLGRDRLGVKQLYYADVAAGFFFASEPKALLALPWVRAEFAEEHLAAYFTFRCVPAPDTLFRGIHKLPAGALLTYDLDTRRSRVERYWKLPSEREHLDPPVRAGEALDAFEAAFLESVRRRLVSDVPVGAFLSGGLDSSTVVAAMHRLGHPEIRTFTATFPGSSDDEATFARRVAERFGTEHHEHPAGDESFIAALPHWVELNDDLVADASSLPLYRVSQLARERGCIVQLSGEGSDELFGGYGSYHKFLLLRALAGVVPTLAGRRAVSRALEAVGVLGQQDRPRVDEYFVQRRSYMGTAAVFGSAELNQLLAPAARPASPPRAGGTSLAALGAFDFVRRIPDDLLVRTDRATMGASVEARVPFLDHDLVDLSYRLPAVARAIPGVSKVVLRRLAHRWGVPYQTIVHRKIGFHLPIGAWFRGPLRQLWTTILAERMVPGLNYEYVAQLFGAHERQRGHFEEPLWRVAALELWYRRWVVGEPTVGEHPRPTIANVARTDRLQVARETNAFTNS
jgi:asparagine synthase (glutamine-hydrolysing)